MKKIISILVIFIFLIETPLWAQEQRDYVIGPNDVLQVSFWEHPELSTSVVVLPDGRISYPVIGDVSVKGLTLKEVGQKMRKKFRAYYTDPIISVSLSEFQRAKEKISVLGEVKFPGSYEYNEGGFLTDYIAEAGGFTDNSKTKEVLVVRRGEEKKQVIKVNARDIIEKGKIEEDVVIMPGDRIFIPHRSRYMPRGWTEWWHFAGAISSILISVIYIRDLSEGR